MLLDAWREFYGCIHNYNNCNHSITTNKFALHNILFKLKEVK